MKKDRNHPESFFGKKVEQFPGMPKGFIPPEKGMPQPVEIDINQLVSKISLSVLNNLKLYVEDRLRQFEPFLEEIDDIKLNVVTLSSILGTKEFFSQEEFKECFKEVRESFGLVADGGIMKGKVTISQYNFQ